MAQHITPEVLTNAGERMIVGNMWGYWAHLSIYAFAVPFARGKRVLDAGSGAGYGSAYLSRQGAGVLALDAGPIAIEHSRLLYAGDAVSFEVADLNAPLSLGDGIFDLVFSSNVFEHVANVDGLAAECARVMKPDGITIIAVPPILSAEVMAADMENQFHVHHIPPTAWQTKLSRFFKEVTCHAHRGGGDFPSEDQHREQRDLPPDRVTIRETDFSFPETTATQMEADSDSITAVFVCRGRRLPVGAETLEERTPSSWFEGASAARLLGQAQNHLENERSEAKARLSIAEASIAELKLTAETTAAAAIAAQARRRNKPWRRWRDTIRRHVRKAFR